MNVYFACSITGGREFEAVYQAIVRALAEDNHIVPTAHLAEAGVSGRQSSLLRRCMRAISPGCAAVIS
jgi:hypothetical protein